jgi:hypothetical protein
MHLWMRGSFVNESKLWIELFFPKTFGWRTSFHFALIKPFINLTKEIPSMPMCTPNAYLSLKYMGIFSYVFFLFFYLCMSFTYQISCHLWTLNKMCFNHLRDDHNLSYIIKLKKKKTKKKHCLLCTNHLESQIVENK